MSLLDRLEIMELQAIGLLYSKMKNGRLTGIILSEIKEFGPIFPIPTIGVYL